MVLIPAGKRPHVDGTKPAAKSAPVDKLATSTAAAATTTTTSAEAKPPKAGVVASVGGKSVLGAPLQLMRLPGRDVDVMLPATGKDAAATYAAWAEGIAKSKAFPDQAEAIATLGTWKAQPSPNVDKRPVVGIVVSEPDRLIDGKSLDTIIALVDGMGCRPVLIPPCADVAVGGGKDARARAIAGMAAVLDGLVGPGGADVDPAIYGEANTASLKTNLFRDLFEADFVRTALDCDLYGFGICRSHQLWNAAAGGSLIQDVQKEGFASVSHNQLNEGIAKNEPMVVKRADGSIYEDRIQVAPKSYLLEATRQKSFAVNSLHHQAVDFAGWGFRVVGKVHDDHTGKSMIEATERWNGMTTQFHPELMQDDPTQRALFGTVGRRAHVFALLKSMKRAGPVTMPALLEKMRADPRYDKSDLSWAKNELGRRLR